jgi:hypothetical protein
MVAAPRPAAPAAAFVGQRTGHRGICAVEAGAVDGMIAAASCRASATIVPSASTLATEDV